MDEDEKKKKVERVFYHELGHFVAHLINKNYYGGLGAEYIKIYPCEKDPNEYCGETEPIKPLNNKNAPPPKERLGITLARIVHGCIFQSYIHQSNLGNCFKLHGECDMNSWKSAIYNNFLNKKVDEFESIHCNFFEKIVNERKLSSFEEIKPFKYLKENENGYDVDMELLEKDITPFCENYFVDYKTLIDSYNLLIFETISN